MSWTDGIGRAVSWVGDLTGLNDTVAELATANGWNPKYNGQKPTLGDAVDKAGWFNTGGHMLGATMIAPFKSLMNVAEGYYNNILEPGTDAIIAGQLAAQNALLYDSRDQGQSWGSYLGESFRKGWDARDNVSLSQSMASAGIGLANQIDTPLDPVVDPLLRGLPLGPLGVIASVIDSADGDGEKWQKYDPFAKESAQKMIGDSPIRFATGTMDFAKELVLDPLNFVGAPVRAATAARRGAQIVSSEEVAARNLTARLGGIIDTNGVMRSLEDGSHQKALQFIADTQDPATIALWADQSGLGITDPSAFGYLASKLDSTEDAADLFRALVAPSADEGMAAADRLSAKYGAGTGYSVRKAAGGDPIADLAEATGHDMLDHPDVDAIANDFLTGADASLVGQKALEAARTEFQRGLDKFTTTAEVEQAAGMQMSRWLGSDRQTGKQARWAVTRANQLLGQPVVSVYKPHRFHPLVAYVERPSGFIRPENPDSYRDLIAQIREVNKVTDGKYSESGAADAILDKWWSASTLRDPQAARGMVAEELNADLIRFLSAKHGLSDKQADMLVAKAQEKSKLAVAKLREKGFLSLVLDDGSMGLLRSSVLQRATVNSIQLYDARALGRAFGDFGDRGLKMLGNTMRDGIVDTGDMVNNLFKVSVLLRLGYTMRNLTEATWSLAATGNLGHVIMAVGPERFQSWKNAAKQGSMRTIDRIGVRLGKLDDPAALEDQLAQVDTLRGITAKQTEDLVKLVSQVDTKRLARTNPALAEAIETARVKLADHEVTYHGTADDFVVAGDRPLSTTASVAMAQRHAESGAAETLKAGDLIGQTDITDDDLLTAGELIADELAKRIEAGWTVQQVIRDRRPTRGQGGVSTMYGPPEYTKYDYITRRVTADQVATWKSDKAALARAFSADNGRGLREFRMIPPGKNPRAEAVTSYGGTLYLNKRISEVQLPGYQQLRADVAAAKAGDQAAIKRLSDGAWAKGYARIVLPDTNAFGGAQVVVHPQSVGPEALARMVRERLAAGKADPAIPNLGKVTWKQRRAEHRASHGYRELGNEMPRPVDPAFDVKLAETMLNSGLDEVANALARRRAAIAMMEDGLRTRYAPAEARRQAHKPLVDQRRHFGSRPVTPPSMYGADYTVAGPFASHAGGYYASASSNDPSYAVLLLGSHQGLMAGGVHMPTQLDPANPRYYEGWSNIINMHFRDADSHQIDPVVKMLLEGQSPDDLIHWALTTKDGYHWAHSIGITRGQSPAKAAKNKAAKLRKQLLDELGGDEDMVRAIGARDPELVDGAEGTVAEYLKALDAVEASRKAKTTKLYSGKQEKVEVHTVEDAVAGLDRAVKLYLPEGPVRDAFMAGEQITPDMMRQWRKDAPDNHPLHALLVPTSAEARRDRSMKDWIDAGFAAAMRGLGSIPETSFARHPLFVSTHRDEFINRIRVAEEQKGGALTAAQVNRINMEAKNAAMAAVEQTLYTVTRRSNFAAKTRWLFPFASAYENVWQRWGRFAKADPSLPLRMANLVQKFQQGATIMDANGNIIKDGNDLNSDAYLVLPGLDKMHLPGRWGEAAKSLAQSTQIPLASLDLLFQGHPTDPGFGPIALLPVAHILRAKPSTEQMLGWTMPYGMPEDDLSMFMPTAARRVWSMLSKDTTWTNTVTKTMLYEQYRYENGERDTKPTMDEAIQKAQSFYVLRVAAALLSPTAVQWTNERDFYAAKLRELRELHRGEPDGYAKAEAQFYQQYPDAGLLVQSLSKNPSKAAATTGAVGRMKQYRSEMVQAYAQGDPELAGFIANYGAKGEQFSQAAYQWQRRNAAVPGSSDTYRQVNNPEEAVREAHIAEGWRFFRQVTENTESMMAVQGLSPESKAFGDRLADAKRAAAEQILATGNKDWYYEYRNPDSSKYLRRADYFQAIISDSQFMREHGKDPLMQSISVYFAYRDQVREILEDRKRAGGSNSLSAKSNGDVANDWQTKLLVLKSESPEFAEWVDRYMINDPVVG